MLVSDLTDGSVGGWHLRPAGPPAGQPATCGRLSPSSSSCHVWHTRKSPHKSRPAARFLLSFGALTTAGERPPSFFPALVPIRVALILGLQHAHFSFALHLRMSSCSEGGGWGGGGCRGGGDTAMSCVDKVRCPDRPRVQEAEAGGG